MGNDETFNRLTNLKYSGAELGLDAVNKHLGLVSQLDNPMSSKYNQFDKNLLQANPWYFHRDLQDYVLGKAKDVQWDASKKILGRFFSKAVTEEKDTQTNNKDKEIIDDLEQQKEDLILEIEQLTKKLLDESIVNN